MAFDYNWLQSGLLALRGQSDLLISKDNAAGRIVNMVNTREGTLRSVRGPAEYHPADYIPSGLGIGSTSYSTPHQGIFHARVGRRDILLAVFDNALWEHRGWAQEWAELVSEASSAEYKTRLPEAGDRRQWNWQFASTPDGIVIMPPGSQPLFYDGNIILPLGYSRAPGPPQPLGPRTDFDNNTGEDRPNAGGYSHQGKTLPSFLGPARVGTLTNEPAADLANRNQNGATLRQGEWRAAVQFVDYFGNLSPLSPLSEPVRVGREDNYDDATKPAGEVLRSQHVWTNIARGPVGTVGRILGSTKDLNNSGDPRLYEVIDYASQGSLAFATLPDNVTELYPYNIPDAWLVSPLLQVDSVPAFRLATVAFGRLWAANWAGSPGAVRPSIPGKWGTFPKDEVFYPDATGSEVTGLIASQWGLLVFTPSSTFLLQQSDDGNEFVTRTINARIGCVAPDSLEIMSDGRVVWLSREGFFAFNGTITEPISAMQQAMVERINFARASMSCAGFVPDINEYRCWVPADGSSTNSTCFVWDGLNWKERTDVKASSVCVTRDDRRYMLALGTCITSSGAHNSVWVLDHDADGSRIPLRQESYIETTWLHSGGVNRKKSSQRVTLLLREGEYGTLSVEAMKDWRPTNILQTSSEPAGHRLSDPPAFIERTLFGGTYTSPVTNSPTPVEYEWMKRRPYTDKVDLFIPSCETYKLRVKSTGDWEFIALALDDRDTHAGGAKVQ